MKIELEQTKYWDTVATKKEFNHEIDWDFLGSKLTNECQILDYGCGYGRLTNNVAVKGFDNIIGIDNSIEMIKRAKKEFPKLNFERHNEKNLKFTNNQFDLVLLFAVLTCIPTNKDQHKLVTELKRVVKPGGLFYISDFLINTDQRNKNRYTATKYEPYGVFELKEGAILRHHTIDHLTDVIFSGFDIIYKRVYNITTMNGNTSKAIQLLGKKRDEPI